MNATVEQPDRVRIDYRESNPEATTYSVFVVQPDGSERPADVVEQFGTQFLVRTDADRSYVFRLRAEWDGVPSIGFTDVAVDHAATAGVLRHARHAAAGARG